MDFSIRRAQSGELDEIGELTAEAYLADGLLDFGEADSYLTTLRDARGRAARAELLVAVDSATGALLGSVTYTGPDGAYAEISRPDEGEFRMLAVHRAGRRRGVGEALVRACLDRARGQGLERVVMSSSPRMTPAHRLYGRLGFVRTPERDWAPVPELTLLTFGVELSSAD